MDNGPIWISLWNTDLQVLKYNKWKELRLIPQVIYRIIYHSVSLFIIKFFYNKKTTDFFNIFD